MARLRRGLEHLERRYAFYAAYHSNPANVLVHAVCVWPILLTAMLPLRYAPPLPLLRFYCPLCRQYLPVQLGFPVAVALGAYYALMDRRAGAAAAALCVAGWAAGTLLADAAGLWTFRDAWRPLLTAQAVLWSAQFFSHAFFEKRRPALVDGPVQAVVTAPLFVFIEVIGRVRSSWSPCGDGDRQVFDLMRVRLLRVFAGAA
ncbi:Os10g0407200 [Oryza sativa Japonica Group]|jgi:uncharacterized membrane protein YGL010W|uniref:Os10g0407200 protein n=2 Tax=Oryza sativa subsp. japonica TaxID=39947 RepID=Q338F7_ORYSJ|nr:YGL010w, putative, expressed [Oryza sativa Japonica Group]KAB8112697.1 hypothetical protein EE612_051347 [Oryza sativa]KAF2913522.1 hypothetical protein DAI22_10g091700 [Oryza sativa Japonica Group]BAF26483.1 Os10g0407200 [Oryza sativa Japonica Group]BAT10784.1 Os10g0407200 [Oryza sativa Japonica Group]|eukprot:NP_001064569.1 Os10g0407200 [Oryza sativa Japonica Group]